MVPFPLAIQNNIYGYKTTNGTFVAFREDSTGIYTFSEGSTGSTVDLGARNTYRYVNAVNVYNKGKADGKSKSGYVVYVGIYGSFSGNPYGFTNEIITKEELADFSQITISEGGCILQLGDTVSHSSGSTGGISGNVTEIYGRGQTAPWTYTFTSSDKSRNYLALVVGGSRYSSYCKYTLE